MMDFDKISHLLTPPDDWQWSEFHNKNNQKIRYGFNTPDNAKALVIIAEGRTEIIEEYFEAIRDFNARGFAVAMMDWQGQGLSYRYNDDNSRQHSVGYEQDISDFDEFLGHIDIDLPQILFAHSMGGNITLRYLANTKNNFKCAYFVAPMLGLKPKRVIRYMGKAILNLATRFGALGKYALGQGAWNERFANTAKHKVSSDTVRREVQPYLFKTKPELRCGGVTFGWLAEALKSIAILHQTDTGSRISTPVFMALAGDDFVVDNDGAHETAKSIPDCIVQIFPTSQHQIHRERDEIRNACLQSFYNFAEKHL